MRSRRATSTAVGENHPGRIVAASVNVLDELRAADAVDAARFGDILTPERLFCTATIDAARALALEGVLCSLEVGKRADIAVISGWRPDPYDHDTNVIGGTGTAPFSPIAPLLCSPIRR